MVGNYPARHETQGGQMACTLCICSVTVARSRLLRLPFRDEESMAKRTFLSGVAVPALASVILGGLPAPGSGGPVGGATVPVIVLLKSQPSQGPAGREPAAASARAAQAMLDDELRAVHATGIKRFTLVNSIAATVSALEARRLAADPAVARVIPDVRFAVSGPPPAGPAGPAVAGSGVTTATAPAVRKSRTDLAPPRDIPGACAPLGKSLLAPEGLGLTGTASDSASAPTARSLGFTGAGVRVAFLADGLDPGNVNLRRGGGASVFTDYRDFTGNGLGAATEGGEAFLDANTIAGQGARVYNVNDFGAQGYQGSCLVRIQGVAPGASLVGLDVFSEDPADQLTTTTSTLAQAINYAVEVDRVNVINESFGGNPMPDAAQDVVKLFDDAAVAAGVVVSVSTGDAGTANTIGSPSTDPNLIAVGATTQFQALAQADIDGARYFATRGWLSDNISSFSSAGFDEAGGTVDLVAPGDLSWASCEANVARYAECVNDLGNPSDFEQAGGTSESAPFVAGAAALVIEAFRRWHGGTSPAPHLVKQILMSTATDLGAPAQEQGAGLLNSYRAVQLAESYGTARRTGTTLLATPEQFSGTGLPGTPRTWTVTVTNEGTRPQLVRVGARTLNPLATSFASGAVTLSDSSSGQYTANSGFPVNYATFSFRVPAGQSRLDVSYAYAAGPDEVFLPPTLTLFDPDGRMAADSEPQGVSDFGNVDVRGPAAGRWTGVVSGYPAGDGGYNGRVTWQAVTQNYASFGHCSVPSLWLAPGQAKSFTFSLTAAPAPGDLAASIVLRPSAGEATTIPLVMRTLIDPAAGGAFSGVLTGGNGRGTLAASDYYQFAVPQGTTALRAELALRDNPGAGDSVGAYLVSPDGDVAAYGQNYDLSQAQLGITGPALTATALSPVAGLWTLIVAFAAPVAGTEVADPFTGSVAFAAGGRLVPATALPQGTTLAAGQVVTIPVTITNTSNAPQDYYLDPRLDKTATLTLTPLNYSVNQPFVGGTGTSALPLSVTAGEALYFVPSETSSVTVWQTSTVPAMTDLAPLLGDPDAGHAALSASSLCGRSVSVSYVPSDGGWVTSGGWQPGPTECGPFRIAAPPGTATEVMTVTTAGFDPTVAAATGDLEQLAQSTSVGNKTVENAVELQPWRSATVDVTFKPAGRTGTRDAGTLYLDALESGVPPGGQLSGDEVAALSYSYKVG